MKYDIKKCSVCGGEGIIERYPMIGMYKITCNKCGKTTGNQFFLKNACQMWNEDDIIEDKEMCFE